MLDAALFSNVVASALMNGVCCLHSMQEEEAKKKEHHEFLRNAIKIEWERQRMLDQELRERQLREQGLDDATILAEERRRLLMAAKIQASRRNYPEDHQEDSYYSTSDRSLPLEFRQRTMASSARPIMSPSRLNHRTHSAPVRWERDLRDSAATTPSVVSSLLDDEDDDEDEDMEEISLL